MVATDVSPHRPLLVDGVDGSLHALHVSVDLESGAWIEEYVEAVAAGGAVPDHVRSRLPRRPVGRAARWRLSGPNPEPG
ncbi:MAG TPA: hypothetical protein VGL47_07610 [Amycolatopsis sp.]|uniref:Uncharacterized protein n=1 Tax=Amycolatopsis nalaikhensis TaxID=715472 RepID=A0ABY8XR04_9PSEU|nr:hypothetical protein [Amycolatopsis sp. 2-2]WIV58048.1 hypothetical protein QP939_05075 [Amycolatopsis sp. 2-2]